MATQQELEKYGVKLYSVNGKNYVVDPGFKYASGGGRSSRIVRISGDLSGYTPEQLNNEQWSKIAGGSSSYNKGTNYITDLYNKLAKDTATNEQYLANQKKTQDFNAFIEANRKTPGVVQIPTELGGGVMENGEYMGTQEAYNARNASNAANEAAVAAGTMKKVPVGNGFAYQKVGSPADLLQQGKTATDESIKSVGLNPANYGTADRNQTTPEAQQPVTVGGTQQTPGTPETPNGGTTGTEAGATQGGANNAGQGNSLEEIQASPIPEFPAEYGQGSGMDRVNWALQHRANIYQAYQKYGITPSADEVNFQLQNNPDINSIEASIKQAVESGQDTRGTMPQSNVTAVAETKAQNVVDSIGTAQSLSDVAKQVSEALGLPELTKELDDLDVKMGEEIMAINDNPWLSEAERSKRTQLIQSKYESRKEGVVERLRLQNDVLGQAMDYYEKDRQYQQDMLFKQIDQQNKEIDQQMKMMQMEQDAMKMDTQVSTKDGRSVLMNMQTGEVIADLGAVKVSGGGGGGGGTSTETKARTTASKLIQQIGSGDMDWGTAWDSFSTEFPQYSNIQIDALLGGGYIDSEATLQALKSAGANVGSAKVGEWWGRAK